MAHRSGSGSVLGAAVVGLLVPGVFVATWWALVERPTCEQTGMFACAGPAIGMYLFGLPVVYVAWSLGLRAARVALPWLAPWAVLVGLVVLVQVSEVLEPPLWVWPVVTGALSGLWARVPRPG